MTETPKPAQATSQANTQSAVALFESVNKTRRAAADAELVHLKTARAFLAEMGWTYYTPDGRRMTHPGIDECGEGLSVSEALDKTAEAMRICGLLPIPF